MLMQSQSKQKTALFVAMCLFCSMVEMVIPKPSFFKIGISNIPVMLALYSAFSPSQYITLVFMRLLLQAMLNGTLFSYSFILSATASVVSATVMYFAYKIKNISFISLSELGAFFSNIAQIWVAHFFLGNGIYALTPMILGLGIITSFICGIIASAFCRNSEFFQIIQNSSFFAEFLPKTDTKMTKKITVQRMIKIIVCTTLLVMCLFIRSNIVCGIICMGFLVACIVTKRHIRILPVIWTLVRTVFITILIPSGKVITTIGFLKITSDAVLLGLHRSFVILSGCWFSRFIIPQKDELETAFRPDSTAYLTIAYFKEITEQWFKTEKNVKIGKRIDKTLLQAVKNCSNV